VRADPRLLILKVKSILNVLTFDPAMFSSVQSLKVKDERIVL